MVSNKMGKFPQTCNLPNLTLGKLGFKQTSKQYQIFFHNNWLKTMYYKKHNDILKVRGGPLQNFSILQFVWYLL